MSDPELPDQAPPTLLQALFGETDLRETALSYLKPPWTDGADAASAAPALNPARLAAYVDGGLNPAETEAFLAELSTSPPALFDAMASLEFLEETARLNLTAPPELIASIGTPQIQAPTAKIIPLARKPPFVRDRAKEAEIFYPLAASSGAPHQGSRRFSQHGIYEWEVFADTSEAGRIAGRGTVTLTVSPEHQPAYEGKTVRWTVTINDQERVLAEGVIENGEIFTDIDLSGVDLSERDPVNIEFST
jgi:hypothetical protein